MLSGRVAFAPTFSSANWLAENKIIPGKALFRRPNFSCVSLTSCEKRRSLAAMEKTRLRTSILGIWQENVEETASFFLSSFYRTVHSKKTLTFTCQCPLAHGNSQKDFQIGDLSIKGPQTPLVMFSMPLLGVQDSPPYRQRSMASMVWGASVMWLCTICFFAFQNLPPTLTFCRWERLTMAQCNWPVITRKKARRYCDVNVP